MLGRVTTPQNLDERFRDEPGRTLADLARLEEARSADTRACPPQPAANAASMSFASEAGVSVGA